MVQTRNIMSKGSATTQNIIKYLLKVLNFNEYKIVSAPEMENDDNPPQIIKNVYNSSLKNGKLFKVYENLANEFEKRHKKNIDIVILPKVIDIPPQEHLNKDNKPTIYPISLFYIKLELTPNDTFKWGEAKIIWNTELEYPHNIYDVSFSIFCDVEELCDTLNWEKITEFFEKRYETKWSYTYIQDKNNKKIFFENKPYTLWTMRYDDVFNTTIISEKEIISGKLNASYYIDYTKKKDSKTDANKSISVAIIPKGFDKVIRDQEEGNENIKSVSPFYIKASLQEDNTLDLKSAKVVWAKAIESPSEIDGISFKVNEVDESYLNTKDSTWKCFLNAVKLDYENRYGIKWDDKTIEDIRKDKKNNQHTIIQPKEGYYWITPDETVDNTTIGIKDLLRWLDKNHDLKLPLLTTMLSNEVESNKSSFFIGKDLPSHHGQMKNEYPLADAQREAVHCFTQLNEGDVLAVSGPPGTGKTTLLQTIVAEIIVENALEKKEAPLILATSSNNKAITNIIEAFSIGDKSQVADELFTRWIDYKGRPLPLAMYWPSTTIRCQLKEKEDKGNTNIPFYTNNYGKDQYKSLIFTKNIEQTFIQHAKNCKIIKIRTDNLEEIKELLHKKLTERIEYMKEIELALSYPHNSVETKSWLSRIFSIVKPQKNNKFTTKEIISDLESLVKKISFIPIKDVRKEIENLRKEASTDTEELEKEARKSILEKKINQIKKNNKNDFLTEAQYIDKLLDMSIRYECFWLAVHYYEAQWLETINKMENEEITLEKRIKEMSLVCPCIIATFFKAPKEFNNKNIYLTNFLDLLIVDEAGQACIENGIATFALAKKAIVVGDEKQIPPVYSISSHISKKYWDAFISPKDNEDLFNILNCGNSCIMKIASKRSAYYMVNKNGKKHDGLFLDEHRRCYDEIIAYSNKLLYNDCLTPCKGSGTKEKTYPQMPIMAHYSVIEDNKNSTRGTDADYSKVEEWQKKYPNCELKFNYKNSRSRFNLKEVDAIYKWINDNRDSIYNKYNQKKEDNSKDVPIGKIISIITPFKLQAEFLKVALGEEFKNSIGTVHTFQGAESPIVIYSTVYGSEEDFTFINGEVGEKLMNVAVSRAKEHFFLFCSKSINQLSKEVDKDITDWDNAFDLLLRMASTKLKDKY